MAQRAERSAEAKEDKQKGESRETTRDKVAIIMGATRGIERDTAINLARCNVDVIFTYRANQAEAESVVREIKRPAKKAAAFALDTDEVLRLIEVAPDAIQTDFSGGMVL